MRVKSQTAAGYARLKRKIIWQICVIMVAAVAFILFIRQLTFGQLADFVVSVIRVIFRMDYYDALTVYNRVIRSNTDIIMYAAIAVNFVILLWFLTSRYSRYFKQINGGIDALIKDDGTDINMPPEMAFMRDKLNALRQTLAERERTAREAEQKKNDLVMYLAHDIKTPLTSIIGYLSLLDEAPDMPAEQRARYTGITLNKAYRLEQLMNEFFEITRYNLQTITLVKEDVDLALMLEQLADEAYPQLSAHGKRAIVRSDDITLNGDADRLARVFNNILKNAAAYGDDGTDIEITARKLDDTAVVEFANAGSIPKEKLGFIFDKFHRLDDARSSEFGGAGLGLSIAKEIVTLHGGSIRAESEDNRTTFTVRLPIHNKTS